MMKHTFKHHAAVDVKDLARYLETLAQSFAEGTLLLSEGNHCFTVHPIGLINLSVKLRRKNGECRMNINLDWPEDKHLPLPLLLGAQESKG